MEFVKKDIIRSLEVEKGYKPSDLDLELAKSRTKGDIDLGKMHFFKLHTCNTIRDKDGDVFEESLLQELSRHVNEKGGTVCLFHSGSLMVGTKFKAEVEDAVIKGAPGKQLSEYVFVHPDAKIPGVGVPVGEAVKSGIIREVSIGIRATGVKYADKDGIRTRYFFHNNETETINRETSFVLEGAQYDAAVAKEKQEIKNLDMSDITVKYLNEGGHKSLKGVQNIEAELASLYQEALKVTKLKAENKALADQVEALKEPYITNILNKEEQLEVPAPVRRTKDRLAAFELSELKSLSDHLDAQFKAANKTIDREDMKKDPESTNKREEVKNPYTL